MASKFDTNPLDPEFPEKARAAAAGEVPQTQALPYEGPKTTRFPESMPTEEQTRRFQNPDVSAYSSPYNGQYIPANYRSAGFADMTRTSSRKIGGIGLSENILTALPYLPWYIGLVAGLLILFLVPKSENKVRFHAAQGLAAHLAILIITSILGAIGTVSDVANIGRGIFQVVTMVMLIIWAIKAWRGKPVLIESVEGLTNWLEEKISPK